MPLSGHSHQGTYELFYEGSSLNAVKNTSQCSLYSNQKNYHQVIYKGTTYEFITTSDASSFQLTAQVVKNQLGSKILKGAGILFSLALILFLIRKTKDLKQ